MTREIPLNPGCREPNCVFSCPTFNSVVLPAIKSANGYKMGFHAYHDEVNDAYRCTILKHGRPVGRYSIFPDADGSGCKHLIEYDFFEEQIEEAVLKTFEQVYCKGFPTNGCDLKKDKERCKNINKEECENSRFWTKVPIHRT